MPLFLEDKALRGISQQFAYPPKLTEFLVPNEKSAQKEERDVLVLQTGAHWTVDEFGGKISREQIKGGYQKMVSTWTPKMPYLLGEILTRLIDGPLGTLCFGKIRTARSARNRCLALD